MSICKRIGIILIVATLLLCSFPLYTFADDTVYMLPTDEPPVNDNSGYLVLYMEDKYDSSIHEVWCYSWTLFQTDSNIANGQNIDIYNQVYLDENYLEIDTFLNNDQSNGYLVVNLAKSDGSYSNVLNAYCESSDFFDWNFADDNMICVGYRGFLGNSDFFSYVEENDFNYGWNSESNYYAKLDELISYIDTLESLDSQQLVQLKTLVSYVGGMGPRVKSILDILDANLADMNSDLDKLYELTFDVYDELVKINSNTDEIEGLLKDILNAMNQSGDSFVDESVSEENKETTDDYNSKSDELTGKDTTSEFDSIKISGNFSSAFDFIWGTIDNFVTGNYKVQAYVLSILSIGIIALILSR